MPNMKAMEEIEKEESKRAKIMQILKAGTKAAAEVALGAAGASVSAEDDDEGGRLLLCVSVGGSSVESPEKLEESFTLPYGTPAEKIAGFAELVGRFRCGEMSQEGFDELTKKSCMAEFWTFGRAELFRAMGRIRGRGVDFADFVPNWDSYRYIAKFTFAEAWTPDRVSLPERLVGVGRGAFMNCRLREVWIPGTAESIGMDAFRGCRNLRKVGLPSGARIGENAFRGCRIREAEADGLSVRNGVAYGGNKALYMADRKARKLLLEEGTERIAEKAFMDEEIRKVSLPSGLREIGRDAFRGCSRLRRVVFPDGMTSIGASAFRDCRSLKRVRLPSGLLVLGVGAFCGCRRLRRVEADEGPGLVARDAFKGCSALRVVRLDKAEKIDGAAFG